MDAISTDLDSLSEDELRALIRQAQQTLDRRAAERARAMLKEIRRLAAAAGYAVTFANTDVPSVHRAAVVAKLSCKRADLCSMFCHAHGPGAGR